MKTSSALRPRKVAEMTPSVYQVPTGTTTMDAWTLAHLDAWLAHAEHPEYLESSRLAILAMVASEPELLETHSWPEILRMAETRA